MHKYLKSADSLLNKNSTVVELRKYLVAAFLAFVVDFTSLLLLTEIIHIYYLYSAALALCLGLITNYTLSAFWVFDHRRIKNRTVEFTLNTVIVFGGLLLNLTLIWFLTEKISLYYAYSKLISTAIVFWWNFILKKYLLFTKY